MTPFKEDGNAIISEIKILIEWFSFLEHRTNSQILQLPIVWHCNIFEIHSHYISILFPSNFVFLENTEREALSSYSMQNSIQIYASLEQLVKIPLVKRRRKERDLGYIPKCFKRKQKPIL